MINYLFYRLSRIRIHKSTYWAKIFVTILIALAFFPSCLTLLKYFWGCYDYRSNRVLINFLILGVAFVVMALINFYYSPNRVKKLNEKYSRELNRRGNIKLILISALLVIVFMLGSKIIRYFVQIPEC